MNKIMDDRQRQRNKFKEQVKTHKQHKEIESCVEENSGILMREGSREITNEDLLARVQRRVFVSLEQIDS